ncbi:hypothetical protein WA026_012940 [Henosepilachna vigintioctopunctata]|uniref:Methuselah N-terminal domain-containing protein n=1 Tax=Henosepilachna vigintioctopunctata TaxID=420089 RepID=A0AAW1TWM0_9CUCU
MFNLIVILFISTGVVIGQGNVKFVHTNDDLSICEREKCIRKCCPEHQIYFRRKCINNTEAIFSLTVYDDEELLPPNDETFYIIHDKHCEVGLDIRLVPNSYPEDRFYIQPDGRLYLPDLELKAPFNMYCMENFKLKPNDTTLEFSALRCDDTIELQEPENKVYSQGKRLIPHIITSLYDND